MPEVTLESEEWYVLCNWLRERENRLMYSLRPKSREWEFVHDLRQKIEARDTGQIQSAGKTRAVGKNPDAEEVQDTGTETEGVPRTVSLSKRQVEYLHSYLERRAWRLLLRPWRSRERRDVRHLRDHLSAEASLE